MAKERKIVAPATAPPPPQEKKWTAHSVGRRKSSVARVYMAEGKGTMMINGRELKDYFPLATNRSLALAPLNHLKLLDAYNLLITVRGGGPSGQAGAVRLGLSLALLKLNPSYRPELKKAGFLTRDARVVERKKPGPPGGEEALSVFQALTPFF